MEIEAFLSLLRDDYIQVEGTYITYNMIIKVLRAPAMFNALKENTRESPAAFNMNSIICKVFVCIKYFLNGRSIPP